jgi:cell wall-associated NlpC family hydrolase
MARLIIPLTLIAFVIVSACSSSSNSNNNNNPPPPPPPATYAISGSIVLGTGTSVENVNVTVTGPVTKTAVTDAAGSFTVDGLAPGTYIVSTTKPGSVFDPIRQEVTVQNADVPGLAISVNAPEEGLSPEAIELIDAAPESSYLENEVLLPNGMNLEEYSNERGITYDEVIPIGAAGAGTATTPLPDAEGPQQKKNDVVTKMLKQARYLSCGRNNPRCTTWDYAAAADDPATPDIDESKVMPAQTGLAYVYGSKDSAARTLPADGCSEKTHGLDCSGLVYQLANSAGISLPVGTANTQADPASWVIPDEWQLEMKSITDGSTQSGDIIAWSGHIGIAEDGSADPNVISATGVPGQCAKNIAPPRGPRSLPMSVLSSSIGSEPTARLRLVTTLSGIFDMGIKCVDQPEEAAVIRFEINNDEGGPFQATGSGTDYDGTPLCFTLDGTYDQTANEVSALLSLCDNSRQDSFAVTLLQDNTGYFPLVKVVDNGGCFAEARLSRIQEEAAQQSSLKAPAKESSKTNPGSLFRGRN